MIGAFLSAVVISGASAYDQTDKEKCLANPDKVVWVEAKGACVPKNPCTNDKFKAYCDEKTFASINDISWLHASILGNLRLGPNGAGADFKTSVVDENYIYILDSVDYIVYKFSGFTDEQSSAPNFLKGICAAFGAPVLEGPKYNSDGYMSIKCGINHSQCSLIPKRILNVEQTTDDDISCKISFDDRKCYAFKGCKK